MKSNLNNGMKMKILESCSLDASSPMLKLQLMTSIGVDYDHKPFPVA